MRVVLLACFTTLLVCGLVVRLTTADISCRSEDNLPLDWSILYKLPKDAGVERYASVDSASKAWRLSPFKINSPNSSLVQTVKQLPLAKAHLLYNDQPPQSNNLVSSRAHAKGILAFDKSAGFWLIHSIPRYPVPDSPSIAPKELLYGQIALCLSVKLSELNSIGMQLLTMRPLIYSKNISMDLWPLLNENVRTLWTNKPSYVRRPPWNRTRPIETKNGVRALSFSKHAKYGEELYSDWIAPTLAVPLNVQSWRRGSGHPLPSTSCATLFPVLNVQRINVSNASWATTDDHSKWAVSSLDNGPWVCVGDINRMQSQEKRGGGAVCLRSFELWNIFKGTASAVDHCTR